MTGRPDVTGTVAFPDVTVEFSPTTDPLEAPLWVDITPDLRSFTTNRGRSSELDRVEAGLATFVMDNHLGQYDPTNTAGPYYGGLRPFRQIRLRAWTHETDAPFYVGDSYVGGQDVLGTSVTPIGLFSGFVEEWQQGWDPQPSYSPDATVTIRAVDAFGVLSKMNGIPMADIQSFSGTVVGLILDVMWPNAPRDIADGLNVVNWTATSPANALSALQEIDASEGGLFFASADGTLSFYDKQRLSMNPPTSAQTWGDALDERQYQSLATAHDESSITNNINVELFDGSPVGNEEDPTSQGHYIERGRTISTLLSVAAQGRERALDALARSSSAGLRIVSMEVGVRDDLEWVDILSRDLLDRVTVKRRPLHLEPGIVQDSTIQRVQIASTSRWHWSIVWTLTATLKPNLLTPLQASFDGSVAGWAAVSNCTLAHSTTSPHVGTECMTMTAVAAGDMSAHVVPFNELVVTPGHLYSAVASFEAATQGRACHVQLNWLNGASAVISASVSASVQDLTGVYVNASLTATAPAGAVAAELLVVVEAETAAGRIHRVDTVGFFEGEQTAWTPGTG